MDAMSDAIDNCAVFIYAVSLEYKESANCRLEANVIDAPPAVHCFVVVEDAASLSFMYQVCGLCTCLNMSLVFLLTFGT